MASGPMRRNQVREFLGVSEFTLRKILRMDRIRKVYLGRSKKNNGRALYVRADVEEIRRELVG